MIIIALARAKRKETRRIPRLLLEMQNVYPYAVCAFSACPVQPSGLTAWFTK
jgi:hypothetical protein